MPQHQEREGRRRSCGAMVGLLEVGDLLFQKVDPRYFEPAAKPDELQGLFGAAQQHKRLQHTLTGRRVVRVQRHTPSALREGLFEVVACFGNTIGRRPGKRQLCQSTPWFRPTWRFGSSESQSLLSLVHLVLLSEVNGLSVCSRCTTRGRGEIGRKPIQPSGARRWTCRARSLQNGESSRKASLLDTHTEHES
jgi:hypothetical protein